MTGRIEQQFLNSATNVITLNYTVTDEITSTKTVAKQCSCFNPTTQQSM